MLNNQQALALGEAVCALGREFHKSAVLNIDRIHGAGHAAANPELVVGYMATLCDLFAISVPGLEEQETY